MYLHLPAGAQVFGYVCICASLRLFEYVWICNGYSGMYISTMGRNTYVLLLLAGESISSGHVPTMTASHHVFPLVNKQANSLLDGLWWKLAYIWIDSSWILADDEERWLLARETRTAHAPILLKPLQLFIAAGRRDGCRRSRLDLPMAPAAARSSWSPPRASSRLQPSGEEETAPGPRCVGDLRRKGRAVAA